MASMDLDVVPSTSICNRSVADPLTVATIEPEFSSKVDHARFVYQTMSSRMMFLKTLILSQNDSDKGKKRKKSNSGRDTLMKTMDITTCNTDYKMIASKMWSAIDNYQIHSDVLKSSVFNMVGLEVLAFQQRYLLRLPEEPCAAAIDSYRRSIIVTSEGLFKQYNRQKEMLRMREELTTTIIQKQKVHSLFLARVCQKKAERESAPDLSEREKVKIDKRKDNIKLARNIINCILAFTTVDYEANPELMRIKEKYRAPLPF